MRAFQVSACSLLTAVLAASQLLAVTAVAGAAAVPPRNPKTLIAVPVNLVANPNFNTTIDGWTPNGDAAWNSTDQSGSATSGSASLTNDGQFPAELSQCVTLPADWRSFNFTFSYWLRGSGPNANNANGAGVLQYYSSTNCSGTPLMSTDHNGGHPGPGFVNI